LRPRGWGVSGILSAWYALTVPRPWAFVPVQAALYATAMAVVFVLIRAVCGRARVALIAVLPFLLLPSAAMLYAQPHRDGFVFFGLMLFLLGWWRVLGIQAQRHWLGMGWFTVSGATLVGLGFAVTVVVREPAGDLLQVTGALLVLTIVVVGVAGLVRGPAVSVAASCVGMLAAVGLLMALVVGHQGSGYVQWTTLAPEATPQAETAGVSPRLGTARRRADAEAPQQAVAPAPALNPQQQAIAEAVWSRSTWLPRRVDEAFRRLTGARNHLITRYPHGRSLLDADVLFGSAAEVIAYMPRAAQIGLLAPFPGDWLPHPEAPSFRNVQRLLMGAEMLVFYALLPFLAVAVWVWRGQPALWFLLLPASVWVMVYALSVPIIGAMVRYRYVAYIMLLSLAIAGLVRVITDRYPAFRESP
jgi:hypothetical protein